MKFTEAVKVLKSLGLPVRCKWRGTTALWTKQGGMSGAKKVEAIIARAEGMGFNPINAASLCSPSGSATGQSSTLMLGTVKLHTSCVYGVTKASNRFTVTVTFPTLAD